MSAEQYHADLIATAETAVERVESKVVKLRDQLADAEAALKAVKAELIAVKASTPVWAEPTEHVRTGVQ